MTELYPLLFKPVIKDYIWGGRNLIKFGRRLPESGPAAESWEIASHEDGMTIVANGKFAGMTLPQLFELHGENLVGRRCQWALKRGKFPLLVKLLDAEERLSVQVHPTDSYALKHEGDELGKTEMWVVLDAEPGAAIVYGLSEKTSPGIFRDAIDAGTVDSLLNKIIIKAGDHVCVPSGTLHAILGGAIIAEIQQNSNTTYRVYDWDRVGTGGRPRELHIDKAMDVINFDQIQSELPEPLFIEKFSGYSCERLCQNDYFTTDRYWMSADSRYGGLCDGNTLEIWGVIEGKATIAGLIMSSVQFVLLPANLGPFDINVSDRAVLLRTFISSPNDD